ncbi:MAG TPA: VOC family protein [Gaiellaceae bacterium]|nr:VOC family protein [Gaiellaceae bacterium]
MKVTGVTPILNVSDVSASLDWFEALGWERGFVWGESGFGDAEPGFASVRSGNAEVFLCRDGQGERGAWMSWFLDSRDELDAAYQRAQELGCEIVQEPRDEPWGVREFHLRHPDGHVFRVGCESA